MDRWLLIFTGGVLSAFLPFDMKFWLIVSACVSLVLLIMSGFASFPVLFRQNSVKQRSVRLLLMPLFCGILWGNANLYWQNLRSLPPDTLETTVNAMLRVDEISRTYPHHVRVTGQVTTLAGRKLSFWQQPRVQLSWYQYSKKHLPKMGERWQLAVRLKPATDYRNHGSFRYRQYLQRQGIVAVGTIKDGRKVGGDPSVRQRVFDRLAETELKLPGLLAALTIGERSLLSPATRDTWQKNGLAHSLAISGLHIGMVATATVVVLTALLRLFFWWFPFSASFQERVHIRFWCLVLCAFVVFGYTALAGFSISTVRAFILFLVVLLHMALQLRLQPFSLWLRMVSAVLLVDVFAWQDAGFWLSVTAVAVLFVVGWRWRKPAGRWRYVKGLWGIQWWLLVSMSPLSFLLFGGFSLFAPLMNVLILPIISFWVLPLALTGTLLTLAHADVAALVWQWAEWPLVRLTPFLTWASGNPLNWLTLNEWSMTRAARFGGLFALILALLIPLTARWQRVSCMVLLPLIAVLIGNQRDGRLRIHVLDVGQSQAVVVERNGRAMLIDTGIEFNSGFSVAEAVIEPFLNYHGLVPERAIISHSDRDHNGGQSFLARRYPAMRWMGAGTEQPCRSGQTGEWNGIEWRVLWPVKLDGEQTGLSKNNRSCVVRIRFGSFTALLPGDIEMKAEQLMLEQPNIGEHIQADALLIPHHGSKTSSSWPLLQAVQADVYLISYGRHRGYKFPHRYTIERLSRTGGQWFGTKDSGQLTLVSDGNTWSLELPFENR